MSRSDQTTESREYTIQGMTCAHCVRSVREEVSELAGVTAVDVELASGRLTVTGKGLDDQAIGAAVEEAGYEVAA
jgi:copper chaperone